MFPLKNKKITGYRFSEPTFYNNFHLGVDYNKYGEEIYAPFDGLVKTSFGPQGGNTIFFYPAGKIEMIRFLHLKEFKKTGQAAKGDLIGIVGFTGLVKPPGIAGSHVHLDISKNGKLELNNQNNFIDPEQYDWEEKFVAQFTTQMYKGEKRVVLRVSSEEQWKHLCKIYGLDQKVEEIIN